MPADRVRAFAPGRVNLIGEHTDYNGGLCLPFAIEQGVTVTAERHARGEIEVLAPELGEEDRFEATRPAPANGWRAYVRGTVAELGIRTGGRLEIASSLPMEAGLGSSAALCVAVGLALLGLEERQLESIELARACARVENDWVGAQTGLMDQLASLEGREGHALLVDMSGPAVEQLPLALGALRLALLDSGAPRTHAASGYNRRRQECAAACLALGVESLREASASDTARLEPPLDRRLRHLLEENDRVMSAADMLRRGEAGELGGLLDASHESLRDLYEASAPEVERTVDAARRSGALGARMVGGGFGGAVLALLPPGGPVPDRAMLVRPHGGAYVATH